MIPAAVLFLGALACGLYVRLGLRRIERERLAREAWELHLATTPGLVRIAESVDLAMWELEMDR